MGNQQSGFQVKYAKAQGCVTCKCLIPDYRARNSRRYPDRGIHAGIQPNQLFAHAREDKLHSYQGRA